MIQIQPNISLVTHSTDQAMNYQICSRCIMDTTVPRIHLDSERICNFCHFHDRLESEYPQGELGRQRLEQIYNRARTQGRNRNYDCIVGVSGGRDSTYLLRHLSKEAGLRCLAVHFNDGFGNPTAGHNITKAAKTLNVEIRTISADWRESKDLKLSCLKASTPDLNLATDIGLTAALYGVAAGESIRSVFVGQSFRTEGIAPLEWNYLDGRYLHAIQKQFGTIQLRPWKPDDPGFHLDWQHLFYYAVVKRIRVITPFYFLDYIRSDVDNILKNELDWINPGAHYYDDLYQAGISDHYEIVKTGISHPIILTSISGMVESGDEIAAYSNGEVVGATKVIDPSGATVIAAWGGYNQYGLELPGYMEGDQIELRLWKHTTGEELYVSSELEGAYYGMTPLTSGDATVHNTSAIPEEYILSQNYPNPFNPTTQIEYSVPESGYVTVVIYDVTGRLVQTLVDGFVESGYHSIVWDGRDSAGHTVSAGLYIYSLKGDHIAITRKMVMMK